jgi:hypothetical protein
LLPGVAQVVALTFPVATAAVVAVQVVIEPFPLFLQ